MKQIKMPVYGADFETDNNGSKAWVVQWAISDGVNEGTGRDIYSFKDQLDYIINKHEAFIYFHNLKFDSSFMKDMLFTYQKNGFTIDAMIRDKSPFYIKLTPKPNSHKHKIIFRDSAKKLKGSLKQLAKLVNMEKLDGFDFYPGWSDNVDFNNPDNWNYVKRDAKIVAVLMQKLHDAGAIGNTSTGDAWNDAQTMVNRQMPNAKKNNPYWNQQFPKLSLEFDTLLRDGFYGGLNISAHKGINEASKDIPITHADVNSMYPTVMYFDPLPIGNPEITTKEPSTGLFVINANMQLELKPGMIPWFTFKTAYDYDIEEIPNKTPIVKTKQWHNLTLTSVDFELLRIWYFVTLDYDLPITYYSFDSAIGVLRPYIDKWIKIKQNSVKNSLEYESAKLMLNSLYGRFSLNPNGEENTLEFVSKLNRVDWVSRTVTNEPGGYLPAGMFITSYARWRLLDYVLKAGCENVIHCDTDSCIHYGGNVPGISYGKGLGEWGLEKEPIKIIEGGFKRYVKQYAPVVNDFKDLKIVCSGVPNHFGDDGLPYGMGIELWDNPELIQTNAELGHKQYEIKSDWLRKKYGNKLIHNTMKLAPVGVPGGTILVERTHKLNDSLFCRR